jgi:antitoxin component YwqK of YwqJK toxin-antitoxin module
VENYKDDKKHGLHKWWKSNGTLLIEEYYDEGKLIPRND